MIVVWTKQIHITPEMIKAGFCVLWESGAIETPMAGADQELVQDIFSAMSLLSGKIDVVYSNIDGMHFFTSGDEESKGLCVAHKDLNIAYSEVDKQLTYLLLANHAKKIIVKPQKTLDEFKSWLSEVKETGKNDERRI